MALEQKVTSFAGGVSTQKYPHPFMNLGFPDPGRFSTVWEEFNYYTAAQWTVGGAGAPVAPALVAGDGGILSMANSAADNDSNFISLGTATVTQFTHSSTKRLFFMARAQVDDATQCDMAFGLQVTVAANNFLTPADGIFLRKADDGLTFVMVSRVGGVETVSSAFGTVVAATKFEVCFTYEPHEGAFYAGFNGVLQASIRPTSVTAVGLRVVAGVQNGSAVARTMLLDTLLCAKER